jgi:hypothetical protein
MKTWLTKFRISNALNDTNAARKQEVSRGRQSKEARQFEETMRELDRRLKSAQPAQAPPPGLRDSVLRAVHRAAKTAEPLALSQSDGERVAFRPGEGTARGSSVWWWRKVAARWLPAPALALLVVGSVWWMLSRPQPESQPLTTAGAALERSHELAQQAPAAVLAPLSKEMESLNRDFRNAVQFLVASVP